MFFSSRAKDHIMKKERPAFCTGIFFPHITKMKGQHSVQPYECPLLFFYFFPSEMPILGAVAFASAEDRHFRREKIEEEKGGAAERYKKMQSKTKNQKQQK
jgi:hypothetical protein